jgi:hypothetical protein
MPGRHKFLVQSLAAKMKELKIMMKPKFRASELERKNQIVLGAGSCLYPSLAQCHCHCGTGDKSTA